MIRPMLRRGALAALLTLAPFFSVHAVLGADDDELPPPDKTAGVDLRDPAVIAKGVEIISGTCGGSASTIFPGGGLPPSAVAATVNVGGKEETILIGAPVSSRGGSQSAPKLVCTGPGNTQLTRMPVFASS